MDIKSYLMEFVGAFFLVFGSGFEKYRSRTFEWNARKNALQYFPVPKVQSTFSNWHLRCCSNLQTELFGEKKIVYFDLCRLIKNYLIVATKKKNTSPRKVFLLF